MNSITGTQTEIIAYLINQGKPQNIRGLARALKKSYSLVYNNLEDLRKRDIISKQDLPPIQIISLNRSVPSDLILIAERKRTEVFLDRYKWLQLYLKDILSQAESSFFVLLVFGSYAKQKASPKSDLDLLGIVPKIEDLEPMESVLSKVYTKTKKQIVVITERDFLEMIKKPQEFNLGNEAVKHHLLLYGSEQYYSLFRKAGR